MSRFALACAKENLFAVDVFLFTTTQNVYTRNCSVVLLLHRRERKGREEEEAGNEGVTEKRKTKTFEEKKKQPL